MTHTCTFLAFFSPLSMICFIFFFFVSDFLLLILKDLIVQRPDLKIILMSATLNANLFSEYFYDCPSVHIPGNLLYQGQTLQILLIQAKTALARNKFSHFRSNFSC